MAEIGLFDTIYNQRQITRYRRDPVPKEDIDKIIEAATKAPSGGNTQPWHFIAITDPDLIAKVGGLYRDLWLGGRGNTPPPDEPPAYRAARYLANHMPEVPAMILICADHSVGYMDRPQGQPLERGRYASSIWLAVQNLFLAAQALGLGTRITTTHIREEEKIKEWLGIPDHIETVCLTPLGYPRGRFGPTNRKPAGEVTSYNRFGNSG
jgi:nitroreductase